MLLFKLPKRTSRRSGILECTECGMKVVHSEVFTSFLTHHKASHPTVFQMVVMAGEFQVEAIHGTGKVVHFYAVTDKDKYLYVRSEYGGER